MPPPPRYIGYVQDEAGYVVQIDDAGVNLTTQKRHDEDGYNEAYYFVANNGRVYQATYTDYDEMHRQMRLYDTRIAIYLGYDKNSNRRHARAYLFNDDVNDSNVLHESWYDYTTAGRVILRDCIMNADTKTIQLAPKQGMSLVHENGRVISQQTIDEEAKSHTTLLDYYPGTDLLMSTKTKEDSTGIVVTSMLREYDPAARVKKISQNKIPRIKVMENQPDKDTYLKYERETYVLSMPSERWRVTFYNSANTPVIYDDVLNSSSDLHDIFHDWRDQPFDTIPDNIIQRIKDSILSWHIKNVGTATSDESIRADDNSLNSTIHTEKDGKRVTVRTVDKKTNTGNPIVETSVYKETLDDDDHTKYEIHETTNSTLFYGDEVKVENVTTTRDYIKGDVEHDPLPPKAEVHTTEDANENIQTVQGALDDEDSFRCFVTNSENCIVYKQSPEGRNYYFYAEKQPGKVVLMAYFGDIPDDLNRESKSVSLSDYVRGRMPRVVNLDVNHQAISAQYPPSMSSQYTPHNSMTY